MRRILLVAVLIFASCGGDGQTAETTLPAPDLTTLPDAEPQPTTAAPATTTTSTTTTTTTTTVPPNAAPAFALSQVVFGEGAFVIITNWGNDVGTLAGLWLSQGTSAQELPDAELAPGQQALVGLAAQAPPDLAGMAAVVDLGPTLGAVDPESGEIGLHLGEDTDDAAGLISYVAWGTGPHLTAELATTAGLWDGAAVEIFDQAPSISTGLYPATLGMDWSADLGG